MTASLLASLFTVIAASTALAGNSVVSAGSVPRGGTSAGTASFVFTESTAACLPNAAQSWTVTIADVNGGDVTFSGTPVVTAPGSLGATASISGAVLTVSTTNSDTLNTEQITVSGLNIKAAATASAGAITATFANVTGTPSTCFFSGLSTAAGTVSAAIGIGATSVTVAVSSACPFVVTGTGAGPAGNLVFTTPSESLAISAATALAGGFQTLTIAATTAVHPANEPVSQANVPCVTTSMASPGTVVDALDQTATLGNNIFPGENNQVTTGTTTVSEAALATSIGFLGDNTVVTFSIAPAGILFSSAPTADPNGGTNFAINDLAAGVAGPCAVSFDRRSCSVTVTTPATVTQGSITLSNISFDVAASVALGTAVNIDITTTPAKAVIVDSQTVAYVARVVVGVAAQPTIYINENDQQSGQLTLTEQGAGFFQGGTASNNAFAICLTSGELFTRAPWAVVTSGNLMLRSGLVGATSVQGTLNGTLTCASWTVFTASTTASTIEIRGADASNVVLPSGSLNGPRYSVPGGATSPGPTLVAVRIGNGATIFTDPIVTVVSNAIRAFRNQPVAAAVNQTILAKGATRAALGSITITETQAGQFKANEVIQLCILPLATPAGNNAVATFRGGNTADQPTVSTNVASGLLATLTTPPTNGGNCFSITVQQQASGALGMITIGNMWVSVLGDAPTANLLVSVVATTVPAGASALNQTVSPARIGSPVAGTAATRLGVTQVGAFTTSTKVATVGKYVTYRLDFGVAAAGQAVQIWGATKTGNDWSAFAVVTTRTANASGVVYYYIRQNSATWKSYRGYWVGSGAWTPARQARWIP